MAKARRPRGGCALRKKHRRFASTLGNECVRYLLPRHRGRRLRHQIPTEQDWPCETSLGSRGASQPPACHWRTSLTLLRLLRFSDAISWVNASSELRADNATFDLTSFSSARISLMSSSHRSQTSRLPPCLCSRHAADDIAPPEGNDPLFALHQCLQALACSARMRVSFHRGYSFVGRPNTYSVVGDSQSADGPTPLSSSNSTTSPTTTPHSKHPIRAGSCAIILANSGHASLSERIV